MHINLLVRVILLIISRKSFFFLFLLNNNYFFLRDVIIAYNIAHNAHLLLIVNNALIKQHGMRVHNNVS